MGRYGRRVSACEGSLRVSIPLTADLDKMSFDINDARLAIEKIGLGLSGNVVMEENDNIAMDILFGVDKLAISDLLAMVPASYTSMLEVWRLMVSLL